MKSFASITVARRANASGSWLRSQRTFGSVNPSSAGLRREVAQALLAADALGDLAALGGRAAVAPEQRGPNHRAVRVEKDRRVHLAEIRRLRPDCAPGLRARAPCESPPTLACHHASGSCSAQPGCGVESWSGVIADARTSPIASTRIALTPLVPTSSRERWRAPLSALRAGSPSSADRGARTRSRASRIASRSKSRALSSRAPSARELHRAPAAAPPRVLSSSSIP